MRRASPSATPMRVLPSPLIAASVALACVTTSPSLATNPRLVAASASDSVPAGWALDGTAVAVGFDAANAWRGRTPSVRVVYAAGAPYAGLLQRVNATPFAGRTVTLEGHLMRDSSQASVGIWLLAADSAGKRLSYVNSYDSVAHAPLRWARHRLTVTVPPTATRLLVGAAVHTTSGVMWIGDVTLTLNAGGR